MESQMEYFETTPPTSTPSKKTIFFPEEYDED